MIGQTKVSKNSIPPFEATEYIDKHPDYTAYHLLLFLRDREPKAYAAVSDDVKARVLCSSLSQSIFMNDWGFLETNGLDEPSEGPAAKALLDVGEPSLPYLLKILDDKGSAPMFGSEEATIASTSRYRRCDFAYRYAMLILKRRPSFSSDLLSRDKLIDSLQKELAVQQAY